MNNITLTLELEGGSMMTTFESDENLYRAIVRALMDVEVFLIDLDMKGKENEDSPPL